MRDSLTILPIAAAVWITVSPRCAGRWWQPLLVGVLCGLAATLKPQAGIGLLVLAWFEVPPDDEIVPLRTWRQWGQHKLVRFFWAGLGCVLPFGAGVLWLWRLGALPAFWEIVTQYYPLYSQQVFLEGIQTATAAERRQFVWNAVRTFQKFSGREILIPVAAVTALALLTNRTVGPRRKAMTLLLTALVVAYYVEVVVVGNFHWYSWIPMLYFLVLLLAVAFCRPSPISGASWLKVALPGCAALMLLVSLRQVPENALRVLEGLPVHTSWTDRPNEIVQFLQPRLQPGDKVQPLDWLGGTSLPLLRSRAELATPFATDMYFLFNTSHPYVQKLQRRFLDQMNRSPPVCDCGDRGSLLRHRRRRQWRLQTDDPGVPDCSLSPRSVGEGLHDFRAGVSRASAGRAGDEALTVTSWSPPNRRDEPGGSPDRSEGGSTAPLRSRLVLSAFCASPYAPLVCSRATITCRYNRHR